MTRLAVNVLFVLLLLPFSAYGTDESDEIAPEAQSEVEGSELPTDSIPERNVGSNVVEVSLDDNTIAMTQQIPSGLTDFIVTNYGAAPHSIVIEGEGSIARMEAEQIRPTNTQQMRLALEPGTYRAYCPIEDHADRGESLTFTSLADTTAADP